MIDLYYAPTPNGWKITIMLEECSIPYNIIPVNLGKGDQFKPEFLAISPNNRLPALIDHEETLNGVAPDKTKEFWTGIFTGLKTGVHLKFDGPGDLISSSGAIVFIYGVMRVSGLFEPSL